MPKPDGYGVTPVTLPKKKKLIARLAGQIETEISAMRKAAYEAAADATHEEARPENDKDTRAIEASYLAAGKAQRVHQLEASLTQLKGLDVQVLGKQSAISAPAVVTLEDEDGVRSTFLLVPAFGGVTVELDGAQVQVVTPPSPLGAALLGKAVGDVFELRGKAGLRELTIVDVW